MRKGCNSYQGTIRLVAWLKSPPRASASYTHVTTAIVEPHLTIFKDMPIGERDLVDGHFAIPDPDLHFKPWLQRLVRMGVKDGKEHLFDVETLSLPTGLFLKARKVLPGLQVVDNRMRDLTPAWEAAKEAVKTATLNGITPRDDQRAAAAAMINQVRGIVTIATNGGKTPTGALAVRALGLKTLWVIERKPLLHQTAEELENMLGMPVGKVGDGIRKPGAVLTVAMAQSIRPRKKEWQDFLAQFQVVIFDEAHHLANNTEQAIGRACVNAVFRYAMTGSLPKAQLKALKIMAQTDCVQLYNVTNRELIDAGLSASPEVHLETIQHKNVVEYDPPPPGKEFPVKIPYREMYETTVCGLPRYDEIVADQAARWVTEKGLSTFVLVDRIEQGRRLATLINERGVKCEFLSGPTATSIRQERVKEFKVGLLPCIVATNIFDEGMNVPRIQALLLAGAGKSSVKLLQRVGRALRRKEGLAENVAHIVDFAHRGEKYGDRHSNERLKIYLREKFDVKEGSTHVIDHAVTT